MTEFLAGMAVGIVLGESFLLAALKTLVKGGD